MLFLVIEFLMRPRRWSWVPFFTEDMKLLAEVTISFSFNDDVQANYAFILVSRISISCGQAICAFNRYSVVGFEPASYNKVRCFSILYPLVLDVVSIYYFPRMLRLLVDGNYHCSSSCYSLQR